MLSTEDTSPSLSRSFNNNNNDDMHVCLNKLKPLPPISRIPGLNPDSDAIASAQQKTFRTLGVQKNDSSYIKLAKQGGRKNLLQYHEFATGETKKESNANGAKRPGLLDYEEYKPLLSHKTAEKSSTVENNSDNNNNNITSSKNNTNNNNSGPGKSIMEMKKKSRNLKSLKTAAAIQQVPDVKERPDLLPVDNAEMLRHLSAPRRGLPKLKKQPRLACRSVRVGGR